MITARRLGPDDAAAFRELRLEALTCYPQSFITTADEFAARSHDEHRQALALGKSWGVFEDTVLVGLAALLRENLAAASHRASIGAYFVRPSHQGTGAADALMNALFAEAREQDVWQLELFVAETNPRGRRFYERHGFVQQGFLPNAALIDGVMTSDIFMTCDLRR